MNSVSDNTIYQTSKEPFEMNYLQESPIEIHVGSVSLYRHHHM